MSSTKTELFAIEKHGDRLAINFQREPIANEFARMYFYSRLLHSLKPDNQRVWQEDKRLDIEIRGWPLEAKWERTAALSFSGTLAEGAKFDLADYAPLLHRALGDMTAGQVAENGFRIYLFEIGKGESWNKYQFYAKGRSIAALCVLYDLAAHPRNDLEITIPAGLRPQWAWPLPAMSRVYGDPSKTADALRNEGWSRLGVTPGLRVFREVVSGARQQMYQLTTIMQNLDQQVMRTNIPRRWRRELYESQDYTCRICSLKYAEEELAPDHRIPVISQADELTDKNFKTKLMTLCHFCNQQKREICKKLPTDYDWGNSPWAYPEKFAIKKIRQEIKQYAETNKITEEEVIKLISKTGS
jgi:hypothetical protein